MQTNTRLTGPERFNLFPGSAEMLFISTILAAASLFIWFKKYKFRSK
jgi:hypothetical protein